MTASPSSTWPYGSGEMVERIRAFDWSRTALGPIGTWTERCRSVVDAVLANGFPAVVLVGPDLVQVYNDGYRALMGEKHPAGLGQPTRECWPEVWHLNEPIYRRVRAGEVVTLEDALYPITRHGTIADAWFTLSYSPLRDADGAVADVLVTLFETTDRVLAEKVRRADEARRAFLLGFSDALRPLGDAVEIQGEACRLLAGRFGVERAYYVEVDEAMGIARVERDYVRAGAPSLAGDYPLADFAWSVAILRRGECHAIADTQTSPLVPEAGRPACAALRIVAYASVPLIKAGRLVGALCVAAPEPRDWPDEEVALLREVGERIWASIERTHVEKRLRDSEELFRSFAENSTDTLWILDVGTRRLDYLSPAFAAMYGEDPGRVLADLGRFTELVHPDDRAAIAGALPRVLTDGETYQIEYRIVRPRDGATRWIQDTGFPIRDARGRIHRIGGVAQDVTDRREGEEALRTSEAQLQVMVAELHHRTRNLIGVTGMIARQLVASSASLADFHARFAERLEALSRIQSLLSRKGDRRILIGEIVRLELDALGADLAAGRVRIEGEPVPLRRAAVQTLSLAIHELATNARKYGALRGDAGTLVVRWQAYASETGERRLRLEWTETGLMPRSAAEEGVPAGSGYSRKLIGEALPYTLKAATTYALGPDRLDCTIDMPLER